MSATVIAFFNNKGGVGKTSLVYHLAWMYSELGLKVVAADLDPQANLTAAFVEEDQLELFWGNNGKTETIYECLLPSIKGIGDIEIPELRRINDNLRLLIGDLSLSRFEDELSDVWSKCLGGSERGFRIMSAFWRILQGAADDVEADVILIDLGPNLGAINRSALIATDCVVVPLSPDLFSLQGLRNLGPQLRDWRKGWKDRLEKNLNPDLILPQGAMQPIGYIVQQHSVRLDRPVKAYDKWIARIPEFYAKHVIKESLKGTVTVYDDPNCLAMVKHYRSLMAMAYEARKPVFHLQAADGAIGGHGQAVHNAYKDFNNMAREIAKRANVSIP